MSIQDLLKKHEGWTDAQWQAEYSDMWEYMKNQDTFARLPEEDQRKVREAQALVLAEKKGTLDKLRAYAEMEDVKKRFINLLGDRDGRAYVESVVIAVANNPALQDCSPKSIMISAMRAASLKLSVDPAMQQAHLVPYGKEATLIIDYHGLVQLSVNTNYYADPPNVSEVFEGEEAITDRFTGRVKIEGKPTSPLTVKGWLAYYKAKNGIERFLYMSNEECDTHAETYNPGGYHSKKSPWNAHEERDRHKMRRKTCLRCFIRRWGNFSPQAQTAIASNEFPIDATLIDLPDDSNIQVPEKDPNAEAIKRSVEENLRDLGYQDDFASDPEREPRGFAPAA
jgi:recombination protein RecT